MKVYDICIVIAWCIKPNNGTVGHVDFIMQYIPAMCRLINGTETKKRKDFFLLLSRKSQPKFKLVTVV